MVNEFKIAQLWDGTKLEDKDQISLSIDVCKVAEFEDQPCLVITVDAPFYNDPAPSSNGAKNFDTLWNYEVVEVFIKGRHDKYVEIEMGPHGHYLVLVCDGYRQCFLRGIEPVVFEAKIHNSRWKGRMMLPIDVLPPATDIPSAPFSFNAYAIHNRDGERVHSAVFPPLKAEEEYAIPDFHKLELFDHFKSPFTHETKGIDSNVWSGRSMISMGFPSKVQTNVGEESPVVRE